MWEEIGVRKETWTSSTADRAQVVVSWAHRCTLNEEMAGNFVFWTTEGKKTHTFFPPLAVTYISEEQKLSLSSFLNSGEAQKKRTFLSHFILHSLIYELLFIALVNAELEISLQGRAFSCFCDKHSSLEPGCIWCLHTVHCHIALTGYHLLHHREA